MTQPLVVVAYEKLLPGSQLVHRLEDQGYRVKSVSSAASLPATAAKEMPLLVIVDLEPNVEDYCRSISELATGDSTSHIPIIALIKSSNTKAEQTARKSGARLVVGDSVILAHLDQFLQQALDI